MINRKKVQKFIKNVFSEDNCKGIFPWTNAAFKSLESAIGLDGIYDKVKVIYPAIIPGPKAFPMRSHNKKVKFLFVGSTFYGKGGLDVLRAFRKVRQQCPSELILVTFTPNEILKEYSSYNDIYFYTTITQSQLKELYQNADIFVLPVHADTFGFVYLEAFSYGLPCIGTNHFAVPEIIRHGQDGLIVDGAISMFDKKTFLPLYNFSNSRKSPFIEAICEQGEKYIDKLAEAMLFLATNYEQRLFMGMEAFKSVTEGRFCLSNRLKKLEETYKDIV